MSKLTKMARELLAIDEDFQFRIIRTKENNYGKDISLEDFELHIFPQVWGSTALGFPGFGCQSMATANTYVFVPINANHPAIIYFAGKFAYYGEDLHAIIADMRAGQLASVADSGKYKLKKER